MASTPRRKPRPNYRRQLALWRIADLASHRGSFVLSLTVVRLLYPAATRGRAFEREARATWDAAVAAAVAADGVTTEAERNTDIRTLTFDPCTGESLAPPVGNMPRFPPDGTRHTGDTPPYPTPGGKGTPTRFFSGDFPPAANTTHTLSVHPAGTTNPTPG